MQLLFENLGVHQDSNSQNGSSLGSVKVHSLTLSYTLGSMRCDSRASLLARNLASPYHGRNPKVRVTTIMELFGGLGYFDMKRSPPYITSLCYVVCISIILWLSCLYNVILNGQQVVFILQILISLCFGMEIVDPIYTCFSMKGQFVRAWCSCL